jgi:hypothetical protein
MASVSSEDSFVINEKDMGMQRMGKKGELFYLERASFSIELLRHINAGDESGFVCKVFCSLRDESR